MTVGLCTSACQAAGYPIAGMEYSGECCKVKLIQSVIELTKRQTVAAQSLMEVHLHLMGFLAAVCFAMATSRNIAEALLD